MDPLVQELSEKLNALDIETSYEEETLFALIRGGASLPDDGLELALTPLELGPRALAIRAQHLFPLVDADLPDMESLGQLLTEVQDECIFARSSIISTENESLTLLIDGSFLLSDLRPPQIQLLLTGLTLFAEEVLLTIGTLYSESQEEQTKEKN